MRHLFGKMASNIEIKMDHAIARLYLGEIIFLAYPGKLVIGRCILSSESLDVHQSNHVQLDQSNIKYFLEKMQEFGESWIELTKKKQPNLTNDIELVPSESGKKRGDLLPLLNQA